MACHLVAQRKARFINVHLVVRVIIMAKVGRLTGAVLLQIGQATPCFILYMDRLDHKPAVKSESPQLSTLMVFQTFHLY